MNPVRKWLSRFIVSTVLREIQVGGHCGLCGKWVERCLTDVVWGVTYCAECMSNGGKQETDERS